MKRFVIWNPNKLAMYKSESFLNKYPLDTYEGLREMEKHTGCSWSSEITTSDIEEVVNAFLFEADVDICYHRLTE